MYLWLTTNTKWSQTPFYIPRFWAAPVMIVVASFAIPVYMREKVVHGLEIGVAALGHFFFLVQNGVNPFPPFFYHKVPIFHQHSSEKNQNLPVTNLTSQLTYRHGKITSLCLLYKYRKKSFDICFCLLIFLIVLFLKWMIIYIFYVWQILLTIYFSLFS